MITQVINVNEILKQALLFDFYGELLVEKFMTVKNKVKQIDELLDEYEKERREDILSGIRILSGEIIEEL